MIRFLILIIFSFQLSAAEIDSGDVTSLCDCPELQTFGNDIHKVLVTLVSENDSQEELANIDGLKLLIDMGIDANTQFKCEKWTTHYLNEENTTRLSMLGSSDLHLGIDSGEIPLSSISPELIHLSKDGQRILFLKGNLNQQEVFFKLIIDQNGKSHLSYIPLRHDEVDSSVKVQANGVITEPTAAIMASNPDAQPEIKVVKAKIVDRETNQQIGTFQSTQDSVAASATIYSEDGDSAVTISGSAKDINDPNAGSESAGLGYEHSADAGKYKIDGKVTDQGVLSAQQQVQLGTDDAHVKVKSSFGNDQASTHHGSLNLKDDKTSVSVFGDTVDTELQSTGVKVENEIVEDVTVSIGQSFHLQNDSTKTEAGFKTTDLSGKMTLGISEAGETLDLASTYQVNDSTSVTSQYKDQINYQEIGLGGTKTFDNKSGKFKAGCMTTVRINEDGTYTTTPQIQYQSKLGEGDAHVVSCEVGPSFTGGEFEGMTFKTQYDYKIPDTQGSVGVYVAGKTSTAPTPTRQTADIQLGVAASIKWGGPNKNISVLRVYPLHYTEIIQKNGHPMRMSYYLTYKYTCDKKKKSLTVKDETPRTFWGKKPRMNQLKKAASNADVAPEQFLYSPQNLRPDTFCPFESN